MSAGICEGGIPPLPELVFQRFLILGAGVGDRRGGVLGLRGEFTRFTFLGGVRTRCGADVTRRRRPADLVAGLPRSDFARLRFFTSSLLLLLLVLLCAGDVGDGGGGGLEGGCGSILAVARGRVPVGAVARGTGVGSFGLGATGGGGAEFSSAKSSLSSASS